MSKEAMNLALEKIAGALPAYIDGVAAREYLATIHKAMAEQPARQQEPVAALLMQSKQNFERNFGSNGYADWIYKDLAELLEASPQPTVQQQQTLTEPQKQALAENWFAEDWAITKAIGMMIDHERLLGIKDTPL